MRVALRPNAELDVLTRDELREELEAIVERLRGRPAVVRLDEDGATDSGGELELEFYRVPTGMGFRLSRLYVVADGFTPAVPFNGAGAFLELLRGGAPIVGVSLVAGAAVNAGALPMLLVDADSPESAAWYGNGEQVAIRLTNGPASTRINVRAQGLLEPIVLGN